MTLQTRIAKLENARGKDDFERWVRTLTDEQLEAEIAKLDIRLRQHLEQHGVECTDMPIKDVMAQLEVLEAAEAAAASASETEKLSGKTNEQHGSAVEPH